MTGADASVVLAVTVVCPSCGERHVGNVLDPLPEMWNRWLVALHGVEQAVHAASGCGQHVRLRLTRVPGVTPSSARLLEASA